MKKNYYRHYEELKAKYEARKAEIEAKAAMEGRVELVLASDEMDYFRRYHLNWYERDELDKMWKEYRAEWDRADEERRADNRAKRKARAEAKAKAEKN